MINNKFKIFIMKSLHYLSLFVLGCILVISINRPLIPWDSWAYHLPFSADIFDINGYSKYFILSDYLGNRLEGFPLLAEYLQGFIWKYSNKISYITLINSISIVILILYARHTYRLSLPILVFGIFSAPLVAVHATSSYLDLFFGVLVSFQILTSFEIVKNINRVSYQFAYMLLALAVANTKMWGGILSFLITLFMIYWLISKKIKINKKLIAIILISLLCSVSLYLKNIKIHNNPFYPIELSTKFVKFNGPEPEYSSYPGYFFNTGVFAKPLYFITSTTDIDWIIRGVTPDLTTQDGSGDNPKRYDPARTGGWWGCAILITLFFIIFLIKNNKIIYIRFEYLIKIFLFITIFTSIMPQSHELRYFLYVPLLLYIILAIFIENSLIFNKNYFLKISAIFLYFFLFIYSTVFLRMETFTSLAKKISERSLIWASNDSPEIIYAKKNGGTCLGPEYNPNQIRFSAVMQGGDYIIEQGWHSCKIFPPFIKGDNK